MKAMAAMRATKAMEAKPAAAILAESSGLGVIKLKPKAAAKKLSMKATAAMIGKKTTKGMKAKNRYTEDFYRLITDAWPIPGHRGGLICGDDEEWWTDGIVWVDGVALANKSVAMKTAKVLRAMKAEFRKKR